MQALVKEEEVVRSIMERRGLDTNELKPVRVRIGKTVGWQELKDSYTVNTTKRGHRILTKREYRTALGMRWLNVMRDQDPKQYAFLQHHVDYEYRWMSAALPQVHPIVRFVNWWRDRAPWKMEVGAMAGEMIQHGSRETYQRYYKDAIAAEKAASKAWRKFKQLKQPKARRRQYRLSQELYCRSKIASGRHGVAMFTRLGLYGERPGD